MSGGPAWGTTACQNKPKSALHHVQTARGTPVCWLLRACPQRSQEPEDQAAHHSPAQQQQQQQMVGGGTGIVAAGWESKSPATTGPGGAAGVERLQRSLQHRVMSPLCGRQASTLRTAVPCDGISLPRQSQLWRSLDCLDCQSCHPSSVCLGLLDGRKMRRLRGWHCNSSTAQQEDCLQQGSFSHLSNINSKPLKPSHQCLLKL